MTAGALDGYRVLDFTLAMAGPFATQKLGDMGADVVKVEPLGSGEWHRSRAAAEVWVRKHNASFLAFNRNKRSLAIDLKRDEAKAVIADLVRESDVVIQNFRPGVAARLGIDYESLQEINSKIVYCAMSGYGETGPYVSRPGQDLILQGMSGATRNIGTRDDPPLPVALFAADATGGHMAVEGILAALLYRERHGHGQKVEVNLFNGILDLQAQELSVYFASGVANRRTDEPLAHTLIAAPYGFYQTSDGYIALSMGPISVLGDVLDDDRLRSMTDNDAGTVNRDEIYRIVRGILPTKTSAEWLELLAENKFWAGPVYDYDDVANDPQVAHNEMIIEIEHPTEGTVRATGIPIKFSRSPGTIRHHQPAAGENSKEILGEAGYSAGRISELIAEGIIQQHHD